MLFFAKNITVLYGQVRRKPGGNVLQPHVFVAPAGVRGLRGRLPAGQALPLQPAGHLEVTGKELRIN